MNWKCTARQFSVFSSQFSVSAGFLLGAFWFVFLPVGSPTPSPPILTKVLILNWLISKYSKQRSYWKFTGDRSIRIIGLGWVP